MQLTVVIAEDEQLARDRLRALIKRTTDTRLLAECQDGLDALDAIRKHSPDIVFLDVSMPGMDGFDIIRALSPAGLPVFVITTAHARFALPAFDVHAVDFLLKPFDEARFKAAMDWARETALRARRGSKIATKSDPEHSSPIRFAVRSNRRLVFVQPSEISWIRGSRNYCELHVGAATHLLRIPLSKLEAQLAAVGFVQINRSTLVNEKFISHVLPKSHGDRLLMLKDGVRLIVSRSCRNALPPANPAA